MKIARKIAVIVRDMPLNNQKNAEALRMSVGLTLRDDKVTILFIDDGVWSATRLRPECIGSPPSNKEFEVFKLLGCKLVADRPSMERRGLTGLNEQVTPVERDEVVRIMTESDIVISF